MRALALRLQAIVGLAGRFPLSARELGACVPMLLMLAVVLAPPLNHDVAAVLEFGQRWIGGEGLYRHLIDVNPPLIFVLNLVPAALAALTGVDAIRLLQLCILGFAALVWRLMGRVRLRTAEGRIEQLFLDMVPLLVLVGAGSDFGQREHLMVLGALPYLASAARRAAGERPPHPYLITVPAAVLFALKPHFLIVPALIELHLIFVLGLRAYLRSPVPWIMGVLWITYAVCLPILFPDYLRVVVPLAVGNYISLSDLAAWQMAALLVPFPLVWLAVRSLDPPARLMGLAALGGLAAAVLQRKGWSYHMLPVELFAMVLFGMLAARWLDAKGEGLHRHRHAAACGLATLLALGAMAASAAPGRELTYAKGPVAEIVEVLAPAGAGERALVLSPRIWPIYPALNYAHVRCTLRTMTVWVLQGAYARCPADGRRYRDVDAMDWAERLMFRTVAEDFAAAPPRLAVIDRLTAIEPCGGEFNFLDYFQRNPVFAATWSRYRLIAERNGFRIYRRADE
jgi:hypothetical protein